MRLQIIFFTILVSFSSFASDESEIKELFANYEQVMNQQKTEKMSQVFSKHFLEETGGVEKFIKTVKSEPKSKEKFPAISWRKGHHSGKFYVKFKADKKTKTPASTSEFVVIKEDGKLKIDGTIGDAE